MLFIPCQTREGDLERFVSHENQPNRPSLSDRKELRPAKAKSSIVDCLLSKEYSTPHESPPIDCKHALINMLSPVSSRKSFAQYAKQIFIIYLKFPTKSVQRLDLVFDRYF